MFLKTMLAVLLVSGGLLAAGCGDDDETTTSSTTEETGASGASGASGAQGAEAGGGLLPDDFAEQANDICVAGNEELDAAAETAFGGGGEPSDVEVEKYVDDVLVPSVQGQIDAITALGEPEEGADELSTALEDSQSALGEVEADPTIITGGSDPFADVEAQFQELGLPACASD